MPLPGAVMHRKISDVYAAKKRWLRGLLSHFAHAGQLADRKISDVYVIKMRWLRGLLSSYLVQLRIQK